MSAIPLQRIEGKYEILEKIREGGMGAIYKVRHRLLDEVRVIKLMRPQFLEDEEFKARFQREARLAIKLRHPNIAQLYDFTVDEDGTAFIVMEFIAGKTLEDVLAGHGPPPVSLTLEIGVQALKALGYLHGKGFVHRDISPDNLMLTEDADGAPLVKLIDLGIAKGLGGAESEGHLTQTGTFLGKVRYASPEQFGAEGAATLDARSDLYSFGIVLYELLTGRFPIQGRDPSSLIAGHLFRPPLAFAESDPEGRVPPGLRDLVLRALAKAPAERPATARAFSGDLAAFRVPTDLLEGDLRRILSQPAGELGAGSGMTDPGSTQERLDQKFALAMTPAPVRLEDVIRTQTRASSGVVPGAETAAARETVPTLELQLRESDFQTVEQTEAGLAAAIAEVEAALARKDYRTAETLLYSAEASFGSQPVILPLYDKLAELRRRDREQKAAEAERAAEIGRLRAAARDLAAAEDFKAALKEVRRAARLDPDNAEVSALRDEIGQASREWTAGKRRAQQLARAVQGIEERLQDGNLEAAEKQLSRAVAAYGETDALAVLRERLEEMRLEATAAATRQAEKERRAAALAAAVAEIRQHLERGDLEAAGRQLDRAVLRFSAAPSLREQWERLEELRRQRKAEVAALLDEARRLGGEEQLTAALDKVREAGRLDPGNAEVRDLTGRLETALRWKKEERRRAGELAVAVTTLGAHLERGELDAAERLLGQAIATHGDKGPLPEIRIRLEELRRKSRPAAPSPPPVPEIPPAHPRDEAEEVWDATQAIADLIARREHQAALKELHNATVRFGERPELDLIRKRLADILLADEVSGEDEKPPPPFPPPSGPDTPHPAAGPNLWDTLADVVRRLRG